ncbi:MAG: TraX family protein [Eubacteriales bacterium]|nr:TraX family protein [Eubacteriales bacterium]
MTTEAKLKTNLDTNFLKLIAVIAMTIDHVGTAFFPQYPIFRWIGRIAFPIFCYCLTVGLLYTHDIKKYLTRLGIFALISQPVYVLAFHPHDFWENATVWNIYFTLFVSLLAMWGLKEKKWWVFICCFLFASFVNLDYSSNGIILMLIFYLCRNKPGLGMLLYTLVYLPAAFNGYIEDPLALIIGNHAIGFEVFALFALPLIFFKTKTRIKVPKWIFYGFYPAHLALIYIVRLLLNV